MVNKAWRRDSGEVPSKSATIFATWSETKSPDLRIRPACTYSRDTLGNIHLVGRRVSVGWPSQIPAIPPRSVFVRSAWLYRRRSCCRRRVPASRRTSAVASILPGAADRARQSIYLAWCTLFECLDCAETKLVELLPREWRPSTLQTSNQHNPGIAWPDGDTAVARAHATAQAKNGSTG